MSTLPSPRKTSPRQQKNGKISRAPSSASYKGTHRKFNYRRIGIGYRLVLVVVLVFCAANYLKLVLRFTKDHLSSTDTSNAAVAELDSTQQHLEEVVKSTTSSLLQKHQKLLSEQQRRRYSSPQQQSSEKLPNELYRNVKAGHFAAAKTTTAAPNDDEYFSACLLVKDDNHFLIEWIAYHYFVLPLRYLVVAVDPTSQTSPEPVFARWRNATDLEILQWSDSDYMKNAGERRRVERAVRDINPNVSASVIRHRARQRLFYDKCMRHTKKRQSGGNSLWTALIDTDEFLMLNYETIQRQGYLDTAPPVDEPGSVMQFLQNYLSMYDQEDLLEGLQSPCVPIPRIRFGRRESPTEVLQQAAPETKDTDNSFNASSFQTLRWRYHASPRNKLVNKFSKTILDLNRMELEKMGLVSDIHRPYRQYCSFDGKHILPRDQVLIIHHYIGTWEQYSYRDDPRAGDQRSRDLYDELGDVNHGTHDGMRPWLKGFVEAMGWETAQALLKGVGELEPKHQQVYDDAGPLPS